MRGGLAPWPGEAHRSLWAVPQGPAYQALAIGTVCVIRQGLATALKSPAWLPAGGFA